jgi:hypothetical protein
MLQYLFLRLKHCKACNTDKEITAFAISSSICKSCRNAQDKEKRKLAREIKRLNPPIITNKICKQCQTDKPISEFRSSQYVSTITGCRTYNSRCKSCANKYNRNNKMKARWNAVPIRNTVQIIDGNYSRAAITYIGQEAQRKGSSVVYWISKPDQQDIFTEGYIGITKQPVMARWNGHIKDRIKGAKKGRPISAAIIKEPELVFQVLSVHQTFQDALDMERKLRPHPFIGWNTTAGATVLDPVTAGKARQRAMLNKRKAIDPTYYHGKQQVLRDQRKWEADQRKDRIKYYQEVFAPLLMPHTQKRTAQARNTSGVLGVAWHKPFNKWRPQINIAKKNIGLGYFESIEEARQMRERAEHIYTHWRTGKISDEYAIKAAKTLRITP